MNAIYTILITSLLANVVLFYVAKRFYRENKFWRGATVFISDEAFNLLNKVDKCITRTIDSGHVRAKDLPFEILNEDTIKSLQTATNDDIESSIYKQYNQKINYIAKKCHSKGYEPPDPKEFIWLT